MNVLVTGGAGYIGSHVSLSLLDAGHAVTIIDDLSTGHKQLIPKKADFIEANVNDTAIITKLLQQKYFDALMHFAGYIQVEESIKHPEKYFENNTKNASTLFNNCINNGIKNIIFSSTASIYGNSDKELIKEDAILRPLNPYGESKVQTENILIQMHQKHNINYVILRYFNVAGADIKLRSGQISKKSTHLIKVASEAAIGKRESVSIYGNNYNTHDGTAIRDYIHVTDLADIHLKSLEYLIENQHSTIMNCGYGKGYSVKQVLEVMNKICKGKLKIKYAKNRPGDAISLVADSSKLMKTIKWTPNFNDIKIILSTAINWEKKLQNEKISQKNF